MTPRFVLPTCVGRCPCVEGGALRVGDAVERRLRGGALCVGDAVERRLRAPRRVSGPARPFLRPGGVLGNLGARPGLVAAGLLLVLAGCGGAEQRPAEQRPAEQRPAEQLPTAQLPAPQLPAAQASTESSTPKGDDSLQGVALPVSRTARVTNDAPVAVVSTAGLSIPGHPTVRLGLQADEWYGTVFDGVENPSERGFILASVAKVLPSPPRGDYCFAVDGSVFGTHFLELAMTANHVSARPWVQLLVRTPEGKLGALPVRYRSFPEDPTPRGRHIDGHYLQLILQKDHVEVLLSGAQKTSTATTCGKLAERRPPTPAFFDALAACAKETRRASGDVSASIIPGPRVPMAHIVSALDALRGSDKPQFTNVSLVLR